VEGDDKSGTLSPPDLSDGAESCSVSTTARGEEGYPVALEALEEPPARIWMRGVLPAGPQVAIVGSRQASKQACTFVRRLASEVALSGVTVVSGGARGIDTAAHLGALEAGGKTVVILGSGMNHPYPPQNIDLYRDIASGAGAVLSEFSPDTPPTQWTFPRRNRIIAALSQAVIVADSGRESGALITAREARVLGRPLGAVPGLPGSQLSQGPHELIRRGAVLIERIEDVMDLLQKNHPAGQLHLPGIEAVKLPEGSDEALVFGVLTPSPLHIDDIAMEAGLTPAQVSAALLQLELAGLVEEQGGKLFVRRS